MTQCICLDPETHVATLFASEGERAEWLRRTYPRHLEEYRELRDTVPNSHAAHGQSFADFMASHHSDFLYLLPVTVNP